MTFPGYLALTAAEFSACEALPAHTAWMACHYACYGTGLSNRPDSLPDGVMLIVNDRTPPAGHDAQRIAQQLTQLIEDLKISCVLLDFQRPDLPENTQIAVAAQELPCPVGVSALYAKALSCPVFLPPVPVNKALEEYIKPWKNRQIWLEAALSSAVFTVTQAGCMQASSVDSPAENQYVFRDEKLHCHYCMKEDTDKVMFTLWRNKQDLADLLQEAERLGVEKVIGLYQELGKHFR